MIYSSESNIIVRNMDYSDIPLIVIPEIEQEGKIEMEKYICRLEEQEKCKNISLVAEYNDLIVGYINIYPFSPNGIFKRNGYSEIVDLKVFDKYKNLGFETKLMDVAEKIASDYSSTAYLNVDVCNWQALDFYIKRGFTPHQSGIWHKKETDYRATNNVDEFVLWLSKKVDTTPVHKFPMLNTPEFPFLKWWRERKKTIYTCVNIGKWKRIEVHDEMILEDLYNNDFVRGKVIFKHKYDTYEDLLRAEGVQKILPFLNNDDILTAIQFFQIFRSFKFIEQFGCIALGIKILDEKN